MTDPRAARRPSTPPSPGAGNDAELMSRLLTTPSTWAVVGLSQNRHRPAYGVSQWLRDVCGHRVIPVHPMAESVFGEPGYSALAQIPDGVTVTVVDCFVNSAVVGSVVEQAIAQRERLGIETVWMQLGVVDELAAHHARAAGLSVVTDTCPRIEARARRR